MRAALWIGRYLATSLLSLILFSSFLSFMLASNFSSKPLDDKFYSDILDENDTYDRIYDEVLADPGIRKFTGDLTGDLQIVSHQDVISLAREIAPPAYLREQVEANLVRVVKYFNDERSTLEIRVDLNLPLALVKPTIFNYVDQRIDSVDTIGANPNLSLLEQVNDVQRLTRGIVLDLAVGNTPEAIPSIRIIPRAFRDDVFDDLLPLIIDDAGIDPRVRRGLDDDLIVIREAFIDGDTREFLKEAAHAGLTPVIDEAINEVRINLDDQGHLDVLAMLANNNPDVSEGTLRADLGTAKERINWFKTWGTTIPLTIGITATVLLFLIYLPSLINALRWPGLVLFLDGAILFAIAKVLENILPGRVAPLISESLADSPDIPPSAVPLLTDLSQSFSQQIFSGMGTPALVILIVGAVMFAASFLVIFLKPSAPGIR